MQNQNLSQQPYAQDYEEIDLIDLARSLKRHKLTMFFVFSFIVTAVVVKTLMMTPIYRATATLFIDQESSNVLTISENDMSMGQSYTNYKEYFQSQKEIILSRAILEPVFNEFKLKNPENYLKSATATAPSWADKIKDFIHNLSGKNSGDLKSGKKEYPYRVDPVDTFRKRVKVDEISGTRLLKVSVENEDPVMAADIVNRIAQDYVERNLAYISKSEILDLHKNEYLKLKAQLNELSKIYKHKHPKIIRINEKLQDVTTKIKQGRDTNLPGSKVTISTSDLSGLKANNVSVQDWAEPVYVPVKPDKRKNVLIGIVLGLFAAVGLALFLELLDNTVKTAEDVERSLDWPFLGYIPANLKEKDKMDFWVHLKPKSVISEAYRTIRTSLLFSATQENPLKSMIVTSPGQQEGKTTTICNLAMAMAQNNKKVLLVDADMRKPRLHHVFKTENQTGLSHFLSDQVSFDNIIHKTEVENLSVIGCGVHPPNPSELLASNKMKEFLTLAGEKFDVIFLDTPPIMMVTDAVILSKIVDGTILVFDSGKTSKKILPRLKAILERTKSRVVGLIVNKIKAQSGEYTYYYNYSKKYYGE